jgi:hypothetical protein
MRHHIIIGLWCVFLLAEVPGCQSSVYSPVPATVVTAPTMTAIETIAPAITYPSAVDPPGQIKGTILKNKNQPAVNVFIRPCVVMAEVPDLKCSSLENTFVYTDNIGAFLLEKIPPGRYALISGSSFVETSEGVVMIMEVTSGQTTDFGVIVLK